ncbi:MAG: energy-coupling factor ABC transporter ATP-binding protein [Peptostreptococcaceae bacterium]|nr:energy-coupling factor ABC transporter ATP-binding protein [Peptostreptococcaceae bacterium]
MIDIKNVSFKYENSKEKNSLTNINLEIKKGEVVILCGESGCGKTTLTRIINGLIPNYYSGDLIGKIKIKNKDIKELKLYEIARYVGSVFQNPRSQFYCMNTSSELAFACENQGLEIEDIQKRIKFSASNLDIQDLLNRNIFNLSGGQKQKIACACVDTYSPEIIVLDEPSSNLDSKGTNMLGQIISKWKSQGKTIIISEHRLYYLKDIADKMVFMKEGKIEKVFSMNEANNLDKNEFLSFGLRPLNLFEKSYRLTKKYDKKEDTMILSKFNYDYKGQNKALEIDSLILPKNNIIGIIGSNGAGKSTFAKCICGLNKKFKGQIILNGNVYNNKDFLKNSYMVMQDVNHQLFTESVMDEVLLSMNDNDDRKAFDILDSLNLLSVKDSHPMSLSGGQKQRVAIASAVASKRNIIIFDEPTSGLDLKHMNQVAKILNELKNMNKTIIIISHDLELILKTCDFIVHLDKGKINDFYHLDDKKVQNLIDCFEFII